MYDFRREAMLITIIYEFTFVQIRRAQIEIIAAGTSYTRLETRLNHEVSDELDMYQHRLLSYF